MRRVILIVMDGCGVGALPAGHGTGVSVEAFMAAAGGSENGEKVLGSSESYVMMCREKSGTLAAASRTAAVGSTLVGWRESSFMIAPLLLRTEAE